MGGLWEYGQRLWRVEGAGLHGRVCKQNTEAVFDEGSSEVNGLLLTLRRYISQLGQDAEAVESNGAPPPELTAALSWSGVYGPTTARRKQTKVSSLEGQLPGIG